MKKQLVVIHGGNTFRSYETYLSHLKIENIDWERMTNGNIHGWKTNLGSALESNFEVVLPRMPNGQNARYEEWKIWFEKMIPYLQDGARMLGHSLGALFLAKYLEENNISKKVDATFLVAAPFNMDGDPDLVEFVPESLGHFAKQAGTIFLYHSKDDPVVPFSELAKYAKDLPDATVRIFENRGHFNQEEFPEIIEDIRSLA